MTKSCGILTADGGRNTVTETRCVAHLQSLSRPSLWGRVDRTHSLTSYPNHYNSTTLQAFSRHFCRATHNLPRAAAPCSRALQAFVLEGSLRDGEVLWKKCHPQKSSSSVAAELTAPGEMGSPRVCFHNGVYTHTHTSLAGPANFFFIHHN